MVGYPIIEANPDGTFVITKHEGTGGLCTVDTVRHQLVYEMGDPRRYLTPDCVADFTSPRLVQEGLDRVRVEGVRGKQPTPTYKVSISYLAAGRRPASSRSAVRTRSRRPLCARSCGERLGLRRFIYGPDEAPRGVRRRGRPCHGRDPGGRSRGTRPEVVLAWA
jgi:hypothetical protein